LNNGNAATFTDIDLSSLVPPTSRSVILIVAFETGPGGAASDRVEFRPDGFAVSDPVWVHGVGVASSQKGTSQLELPCSTSQVIEYKVSDNVKNLVSVSVAGFDDEL
jgi:hypothetical protein